MNFKERLALEGKHSFLSPSKHGWTNDTEEELTQRWINSYATTIGTLVHAYASDRITKRRKILQQSSEKNHLLFYLLDHDIPQNAIDIDFLFYNMAAYVNDAIGYRMLAEKVIAYTENAFGTADAHVYRNHQLRIHDLKTGTTPASMEQLIKYAALWFLDDEYGIAQNVTPENVEVELRIYQGNEVKIYTPTADEILTQMDIYVRDDLIIEKLKAGV